MSKHKEVQDQLKQLAETRETLYKDPQEFQQKFDTICLAAINACNTRISRHKPIVDWCLDTFEEIFTESSLDDSAKKVTAPKIVTVLNGVIDHNGCYAQIEVFQKVLVVANLTFNFAFMAVLEKSEDYNGTWYQLSQLKKKITSKLTTDYPISSEVNESMDNNIGTKLLILDFLGKVVQAQTPAPRKDPRKRDRNPSKSTSTNINSGIVSISVGSGHPFSNETLKAEAFGLLDLLIMLVVGREFVVPQINSCVFFILTGLIKARPSLTNKILAPILKYDSSELCTEAFFSQKTKQTVMQNKLARRFSDRAFRLFLTHLFKAGILTSKKDGPVNKELDPDLNVLAKKKLAQITMFQDKQRKEKNLSKELPEDVEYTKKIEEKKKSVVLKKQLEYLSTHSKMSGAELERMLQMYPQVKLSEIVPKEVSSATPAAARRDSAAVSQIDYSKLFNLEPERSEIASFDASQLQMDILSELVLIALQEAASERLTAALNIVSQRYEAHQKNMETSIKRRNEMSDANAYSNKRMKLDDAMGMEAALEYALPEPKEMSFEEKKEHLKTIVNNFFKLADSKEVQSLIETRDENETKRMSQVAISKWEKNSWVLLLARMATRGFQGEKSEELANIVRTSLYEFFLDNIHSRVDLVVDWLNEEWYAETTQAEVDPTKKGTPTYLFWTSKVLDSIIPFLDSKDRKIFIRLLSDLPFLNKDLISKIQVLCWDRLRSKLGLMALQYLIMFRPPVKQACIEVLEELKDNTKENEALGPEVEKLLKKYKA